MAVSLLTKSAKSRIITEEGELHVELAEDSP